MTQVPPGWPELVGARTQQTARTIMLTISEEQCMSLADSVRFTLDDPERSDSQAATLRDGAWRLLHDAWYSVPDND